MKPTVTLETETIIYSLGRLSTTVQENNHMILFENGYKVRFSGFIRELSNDSKCIKFKYECSKILKSKSLKKKQAFLENKGQTYIDIINRDFGLFNWS